MLNKAEILKLLETDTPEARRLVSALVNSPGAANDNDILTAARRLADKILEAE